MRKIYIFLVFANILVNGLQAQNVGIGTINPHPNAILDVNGKNKGLLIPRGDAATRNILNSNTAKGLLLYDSLTNTMWVHNGNGLISGWNSISNGNNYWQQAGVLGTEIKNTNSGGLCLRGRCPHRTLLREALWSAGFLRQSFIKRI